MTEATAPLTARLAELISDDDARSEQWLDLGERAFADTIGVLIAGSREASVRMVAELSADHGQVLSLATGSAMTARSAALVDGTSAHALDYDDVDDAIIAHVGAVLVPALMAAAQTQDSFGVDLLDAFRVGVIAGRIIGAALDVATHYRAGWHSTGTIGTVAAAAATSRLLRLADQQARCALGIAGSLASGSRQNFGTMTKPLHVGAAASNGLSATLLAARGFTADTEQLDGPLGFLALHRHRDKSTGIALGDVEAPIGLNVKLLPCCYATHEAAEAATAIADTIGDEERVEAVEVVVQPEGLTPLVHHRPQTGTEAKFCMEYVVAAALLDRGVTFASFTDERVQRADVQRLLTKVSPRMSASPPVGPDEWTGRFAVVTVRFDHGSRRSMRVDRPIGHVSRPLPEDQLRAKFADCVRGASPEAISAAYHAVRNLREQPSANAVVRTTVALHSAGLRTVM